MNSMQKLLDFLWELRRRGIYHTLSHPRDEAIMVEIRIPGAFWEAEFFADGHVEVEVFDSKDGVIVGTEAENALARLLREDDEAEAALGRVPPVPVADHNP